VLPEMSVTARTAQILAFRRRSVPAGARSRVSSALPTTDAAALRTELMDPESSVVLLERVRQGDKDALETLLQRYVPALRRWARGRLPRWARDMADTEDLVQDTVLRGFRNLPNFDYRHDGALYAYLRQAVLNRIRDECRRVGRRPRRDDLDDGMPDRGASPLEAAIGADAVARYEAALQQLKPEEREAIIARIEMGYSYAELAVILGKSTADAARVATSRALLRLAGVLRDGG
jgi:RNA polymerase sigma factor (sigma-70 family)